MRAAIAALVIGLAGQPAPAGPPRVDGGGKVLTRVGGFERVVVTLDPGAELAWFPGFAPEDCFFDELKPLAPDTARFVIQARRPGVFRVGLVTVGERQFSELVITAGDGPDPPKPPPDPPAPADPLAAAVTAAFGADPSATKAADAKALAATYRELARQAVPAAATAGVLADIVERSRRAAVGDRLRSVRELFGREYEKVVPADPTATLTADQKVAADRELKRFAALLERVVTP